MPEIGIRLGVLASGRGSNLQAIIDAIGAKQIDASVAVVISDKEGCQALERAGGHGIQGVFLDPKQSMTREAYDDLIVDCLNHHGVDLVVLAGFMRIVTSRLIQAFKNRIMNIHPSLLPSFSGLQPQEKSIEWGIKVSGCTVHFVEETVDQGPIIIQAALAVREEDTPETLKARILEQEHRILPQAVQYFAKGRLEVRGRRVHLKEESRASNRVIISPPVDPRSS